MIAFAEVEQTDAASLTNTLRDALIHSRASPKRLALFHQLSDQLYPGSPGLKPLCPTRWTVRTASIDAILKNYAVICEELTEIGTDSHGEASTFYGLKLAYLTFGASEQLSSTLQYKDINAQEVSTAVSIALAFFQRQRCDFACESIYNSTVMNSWSYTQEPDLPRQKNILKGFLMVLQFNNVPL